ncbi:CbiX/SirB N-terminal domain-containing protein [Oscillospiraceae bacterium CM]|nr:CbiX/SirB N-terminal domain-containing protein [Oscillospiraceae bacterium CM]
MTGILLLAHGSREGDTEKTMAQITSFVKEILVSDMIEEAYLQFRDKNLEAGIKNLIDKGADNIVVIPYFLFAGIHIKEDIPGEIAALNEKYPHVKMTMGSTLGTDRRLAEIVSDRVRQVIAI